MVINGVEKRKSRIRERQRLSTSFTYTFAIASEERLIVLPLYFFWKEAARAALCVRLEGAAFACSD